MLLRVAWCSLMVVLSIFAGYYDSDISGLPGFGWRFLVLGVLVIFLMLVVLTGAGDERRGSVEVATSSAKKW